MTEEAPAAAAPAPEQTAEQPAAPADGERRGRGFGARDRRGGAGGRPGGPRGPRKDEWIPVTKLGRLVKGGKITSLEEIYTHSIPIKESQIVDKLISSGEKKVTLSDEVMKIVSVQKQTKA